MASPEKGKAVSRPENAQGDFDPSSSRCLAAFTVAINQACDRQDWYTSTKELQLASLRLCGACRSVTTLLLRVDNDTPPRLLAAADAPFPDPEQGSSTRVARLRARTVTWKRPSSELSRPLYALADVDKLVLSHLSTTEGVVWPHRLRALCLGSCNLEGIGASWPSSLQQLELGPVFNQPAEGVAWPPSLQQLTFGIKFNQPVEGVAWPPALQQLTFGIKFNQPVEGASWPPSLQQLMFGYSFNQPVEGVVWPPSLQQLTFGIFFNQPVEGVAWPPALQQLTFGIKFNQPVANVRGCMATVPSATQIRRQLQPAS